MLTRKKVQTTILLVFGIILLVNIVSSKLFFRLDFTADKRYSLSDATKDILDELDDPVTVTAYFSEDLPPDISKVRNDFRDLLVEYSNLSGGQVVYEFINPSEDQQTEMQAQQNGISPIMINVRERDQLKQQRAYLGALIQLGERKEVIPLIQPGSAMEFALSTNIKKLAVTNKPKIALFKGFGSPTLAAMQQLNTALSVMYDVDEFEFNDTVKTIPLYYKSLIVVAPKDTIPAAYFGYFDDYLSKGGRMVVAANRVEGDLQQSQGKSLYTGISEWLAEKGLEIEDGFVVDINCASVTVQQRQGMFVMNTPVQFPYLPIITNFTEHPITEGLEAVILPFASALNITPKDTSINIYPIAMTSEKSGVEKAPLFFNIQKDWRPSDFNLPSVTVGAVLEGRLAGNAESKMVVFGDGDFVVNGEGQGAQRLQPDNISLMVNSIDWLSDDTGLIALRTKGVSARPIDAGLEDGTKTILKYMNFLIPIFIIVVYGVFRFQLRRKLRNKMISVDYVQ
jgi:gliding-associated putative ABC transporter substrate-binding component GldG